MSKKNEESHRVEVIPLTKEEAAGLVGLGCLILTLGGVVVLILIAVGVIL